MTACGTSLTLTLSAPTRGRGFTLAELVVSLVIMSILMVGLGSAILIASHALPERNTSTDALLEASELVDQIAGELNCALAVTERSGTSVEFTVPDRNADLAAETIRYAWSGTPGDPLTRQYNVAAVVKVLDDVHEFDLGYTFRTLTETTSQETTTDSGEVLVAFFDDWAGITESELAVGVDVDSWVAESFSTAPSVPADATSLTIARVHLQMRQGPLGNAGNFSVGIHPAIGGSNPEPAAGVIGTPVVKTGAYLPVSFAWCELTFADVVIANPATQYVIVVKGTDTGGTARDAQVLRYYDKKAPADGWVGLWTPDSGASWAPNDNVRDDYDFPFYVYGSYTSTSMQDVDVSRYFVSYVRIRLRTGSDSAAAVETAAQVLNEPEVAGP